MIMKTTIAAALLSLGTLAAVPAQAAGISIDVGFGHPGYGWSDHGHWQGHRHMRHLSADEVRGMLRDNGYRQIRFFDDHGPVYKVGARKHGDSFILVVSARSGEILSRTRI